MNMGLNVISSIFACCFLTFGSMLHAQELDKGALLALSERKALSRADLALLLHAAEEELAPFADVLAGLHYYQLAWQDGQKRYPLPQLQSLLDSSNLLLDRGKRGLNQKLLRKQGKIRKQLSEHINCGADASLTTFKDCIDQFISLNQQAQQQLAEVASLEASLLTEYRKATQQFNQWQVQYPSPDLLQVASAATLKKAVAEFKKRSTKVGLLIQQLQTAYNGVLLRNLQGKQVFMKQALEHYGQPIAVPEPTAQKWHLYDFAAWFGTMIDQKKISRKPQAEAATQAFREWEKALLYPADSVHTPTVFSLPENLAKLDTESFWQRYFQFRVAAHATAKAFENEGSFLNYRHTREEIIHYYHGIMERTERAKKLVTALLDRASALAPLPVAIFADEAFNGKNGLKHHLQEVLSDLQKRENYCTIKLKDQLMADYIEAHYLPQYAEYEGQQLPLYEQPVGMASAYGQFVTTKVHRTMDGHTLFLSGYRKMKQKLPFLAKVVDKQVVWVRAIPVEDFSEDDRGLTHGWGQLLDANAQFCMVVVKLQQETVSRYKLYQYDQDGELMQQHTLANMQYPPVGLKAETDGYQLISNKGNTTLFEKIDFDGELQQRHALPFSGQDIQLLTVGQYTLWIANVVNPLDAHGLRKQYGAQNDPRVAIVAFDEGGRIVAQKYLRTKEPHFMAYVSAISDSEILVLGFKGAYDFNQIADYPLMQLTFDPALTTAQGNISLEGKL